MLGFVTYEMINVGFCNSVCWILQHMNLVKFVRGARVATEIRARLSVGIAKGAIIDARLY
jgi:hypothetical protein